MLVALGTALAGCGGDDAPSALPGGPATDAGSTAAAPTTPPAGTAAAADPAAAYLAYWDGVLAAHRSGDPAGLAAVATEPQLGRVRAVVDRNRTQRLSVRGEVGHEPEEPTVDGTTATIEDCYDLTGWNPVDLRTGKPVEAVEAGGTGRYRARFTLRRAGSGWLVADQAALGGC